MNINRIIRFGRQIMLIAGDGTGTEIVQSAVIRNIQKIEGTAEFTDAVIEELQYL